MCGIKSVQENHCKALFKANAIETDLTDQTFDKILPEL